MKKLLIALAVTALLAGGCKSVREREPVTQPDYDSFFTPERLRIDLILGGDARQQHAYLDRLWKEDAWAGPRHGLIDPFGYGDCRYQAFVDGRLVFSKGFSTLFQEWRTTAQASQVAMATGQTLWMPFPKQKTRIVVEERIRETGKFSTLLDFEMDPEDRHIVPGPEAPYRVVPMQIMGDIWDKADIAIVAEAYTQGQMAKFRSDCCRMMDYVFSMEPYASRKEDFNIWMVESVSEDGGVDIPQDGIWRNTVMDSMFDTFYEDRYLTVMNHTKIAAAVSGVPFDAIIVLANDSKYGGGGIYNSYAMGTSDHPLSQQVFIHEFGHSFAGLGDEYYDSSVAYEGFYNNKVEPWEPNVTTLVDFGSKWKDLIADGTPVPTPNDSSYIGTTGVFEGAGYVTTGCYRPYFECRMKNNTAPGFCPVCRRAIGRMIDYYSDKTIQ